MENTLQSQPYNKLTKDKASLAIFFGITPFNIFGIHDFIVGHKKRGLAHLMAFLFVFTLYIVMPALNALEGIGVIKYSTPEMGQLILQIVSTTSSVLMGASFIIGIVETLLFIQRIKELPPGTLKSEQIKEEEVETETEYEYDEDTGEEEMGEEENDSESQQKYPE